MAAKSRYALNAQDSAAVDAVMVLGLGPDGFPSDGQAGSGGQGGGLPTIGAYANVQVAPTVTAASAYASGNVVGGLLTFSAVPSSGFIAEAAVLAATAAYTGQYDLLLFSAAPAGGGITDKSALAIAASDLPKLIGVFALTSATALGAADTYTKTPDNPISYNLGAGNTTLYGVLVVRGTPTYTNATDVAVSLGIAQ